MTDRLSKNLKRLQKKIELRIGTIQLKNVIGEGGNGVVYDGKIFNQDIALKFLKPNETGKIGKTKLKRFLAEYFNVMLLENSKGIVSYINYDVLHLDDLEGELVIPVILMKKYKSSLKDFAPIEDEKLFIKLFNFLIATVEYIHKNGIIHRDLKPENILFDGDNFFISDFGIAKYNPDIFKIRAETNKKERVGNRLFSAPEQEMSDVDASPTMDIYAIGQILHWLVFSQTHRGTNRKPVATKFQNLKNYDYIIDRCLSNNPRERYQTVDEIREHWKALFSRKKNHNDYLSLFEDLLSSNYPKNENWTVHSNDLGRIDKLLKAFRDVRNEFDNHLIRYDGNRFSSITELANKKMGVWAINERETEIEEIWIYYDGEYYNDFIIVHYKKGNPFFIDGQKKYENILVDDKFEISNSEYYNGFAEIDNATIQLNNHKVERIYRNRKEGSLIICTRYHCIFDERNKINVISFLETLKKNKYKLGIDTFNDFAKKLRRNIPKIVLPYL